MTLKTVTGPSTREALAHARRLFGTDVVLLQSAPAAHGQPASVTVAFDTAPNAKEALAGPLPPEAWTATPAHPEPVATPAPRAYGYSNMRKSCPPAPEPISAPAPARTPAIAATGERPRFSNGLAPARQSSLRAGHDESLACSTAKDETAREPTASASEVAALRARLVELEAVIAQVRTAVPPPVLRRAPLVFVGPGGSGKTSMALRLAQSPELTNAQRPAVLIVAPDAERYVDPAPVFWGVGVPVAVVQTPDEVIEALDTFADADLLLVDTPSLPLSAERARPVVRRLGDMLAPLGTVEVHFVLDATRSRSTVTAAALHTLGLTPDALALARLDEAPVDAVRWADHLELPIQFTSSGPDLDGLSDAPLASPTQAPSFAVEPVVSRTPAPSERFNVAPVSPAATFTHIPVLA